MHSVTILKRSLNFAKIARKTQDLRESVRDTKFYFIILLLRFHWPVVSREVDRSVPPLEQWWLSRLRRKKLSLDRNFRNVVHSHINIHCIKAVYLTRSIILYNINSNYGTKNWRPHHGVKVTCEFGNHYSVTSVWNISFFDKHLARYARDRLRDTCSLYVKCLPSLPD